MKSETLATLREVGGFAALDDWSLIAVTGVDAQQFLQARVTSDVKALKPGDGQESALLDRKAHLVAYFSLYFLDNSYWIVCTSNQVTTILKELETYLFAEKVSFKDESANKIFFAVQGAYSQKLLSELIAQDNQIGQTAVDGHSIIWIRKSITGELGYFLVIDKKDSSLIARFEKSAEEIGMAPLSKEILNTARIEAGLPQVGIDVGLDNLLPETSLDAHCVSYTKGCYLGQEVIARVKAQGAPRRGLMGLVFEKKTPDFAVNTEVLVDDKSIGQLKSNVFSPTLGKSIALILITREYRVPDSDLSVDIDGTNYKARVISLPFIIAKENNERAQAIYELALSLYTKDDEDKAIELLRQAISLHPTHADSYEMLGVMLGKRGQLDEAISLMKKLEHIDPESVMAHANLSLFYVQQGDKEKAEEEKALAMNLRMQQATRELGQQQEKQDERKRKAEEAQQRMGMFKQVIAIDAEDLLANFGLGNLYVELEQYEPAVPLLKKAIAVKPDYTAAFLALGQALAGTKKYTEAMDIYRQGIAVASKRGDFEPMNKMKEKLAALEAREVSTGAN
ncbi:MAG: tetratricopeptide repeat protein [Candidatus Obscuribacterales bacterium]|nr:tetratricopeptide repeat protein [Candidatus Obscuribacterales bacterium]